MPALLFPCMLAALAATAQAGQHALLLSTAQDPESRAPLALDRDLDALAAALETAAWGPVALERADAVPDPLAALQALVPEVEPGDQLLVHISGHGKRVEDDDQDEPDGWDEGLLRADGSVLRDDELRPAIDALRERLGPDGQLVLTLDTCHSSGLVRSLGPARRGRGPAVPDGDLLGSELLEGSPAAAPLTVLAAARAAEVAEEHPDGGGLFSRALAAALVWAPAERTWAEVHAQVQAAVARAAPHQHPVLIGDRSATLGAGDGAGGLVPDGVVAGPPALVRVTGGRLLGLGPEDRFSLRFPDGAACPATVHTTTDSQLLLAPGCETDAAALAAARVVLEREGGAPLAVTLDLPPALRDRLIPELAAEGWEEGPSAWQLSLDGDALSLVVDGQPRARAPAAQPWRASPVAVALRQHHRATELAALELHGDARPALRLRSADPETCAPGPVVEPAPDGTILLPPGEGMTVELRHGAPGPRALHLVHFDADGEAAVLLDGEDAPVLAPGESWTSPLCWQTVPPWGTERLKLIATRAPTRIGPWLSGTPLRGDWTRDGTTTTLTYTLTAVTAWAGAAP